MKRLTSRAYATALMAAWAVTPSHDRPAMIQRCIALLWRQRATKLMPRILDWIGRLEDAAAGRTRVTVTSAVPVDVETLTKELSKKLGAVVVATATDPKLIGGLAIRVGDTVVDGTVATRLQQLHHHLRHPSYV